MKIIQPLFQPTLQAEGVNVIVCRDEKTNDPRDVLMERRFLGDENKAVFFSSSGEAHRKAIELSEKHGTKFAATFSSFSDGLFGHVISLPLFDKFLN